MHVHGDRHQCMCMVLSRHHSPSLSLQLHGTRYFCISRRYENTNAWGQASECVCDTILPSPSAALTAVACHMCHLHFLTCVSTQVHEKRHQNHRVNMPCHDNCSTLVVGAQHMQNLHLLSLQTDIDWDRPESRLLTHCNQYLSTDPLQGVPITFHGWTHAAASQDLPSSVAEKRHNRDLNQLNISTINKWIIIIIMVVMVSK